MPVETHYDLSQRDSKRLERAQSTLNEVSAALTRQREVLEKLTAKGGDTRGARQKVEALEAAQSKAQREVLAAQEPIYLCEVVARRTAWMEALNDLRACRNELKELCR